MFFFLKKDQQLFCMKKFKKWKRDFLLQNNKKILPPVFMHNGA